MKETNAKSNEVIDDKRTWRQMIKAKLFKQPTDIFKEADCGIIDNMPLDNGNLFTTTVYLESLYSLNNIMKYNLLLDSIRSIRNIFTIKNDKDLEKSWQNILTVFLMYGAVGLRFKKRIDNQILQVYGIMNFSLDEDMSIKTAEGYLPTVLNRGYMYGFDKKVTKLVNLNNNTAVFGTYGTEALSLLVRVMPLINARYRTLKIASGNVTYHNKKTKMKYGGGNSEELNIMLDSVTNDNSKVIIEFDPGLDLSVSEDDTAILKGKKKPGIGVKKTSIMNPTTFEPFQERGDVNKDVWVDYDKFTDLQNELLGVRFNGAKKASRNTTNDVKSSNAKTLLIEKDLEISLQILINSYNEKYNRNAQLVKTHDEEFSSGVDDPINEKENT